MRRLNSVARSQTRIVLLAISEDKNVMLGLITSKRPELEDTETAKYIPLECLSISPQCGFASCEIGKI